MSVDLGFTFALTLASVSVTLAHPELYTGCTLNSNNFVDGDEIYWRGEKVPTPNNLEECDAFCVDTTCTYFTWSHVSSECRLFRGEFTMAPVNAKQYFVSGIAGCTSSMTPEDKVPCATPNLSATFGTCEPSSLASGCYIDNVRPTTGCNFCGEALALEDCPAQYTLCDDEETTLVEDYDYSVLSVHCSGVCTDVQVLGTVIEGNHDDWSVFDDGFEYNSYMGSHGPGDFYYDWGLYTGDELDQTFTYGDDKFYVYTYNADEDGVARFSVSLGTGNGYALTCALDPTARKRSIDMKPNTRKESSKQGLRKERKGKLINWKN